MRSSCKGCLFRARTSFGYWRYPVRELTAWPVSRIDYKIWMVYCLSPSPTPPVVLNLLVSLFTMRFSTIFTVIAAGAMAFASSVPELIAKRSTTDIQNAFSDLGDKCSNDILPKFDDCSDDTCTIEICAEIIAAIDDCKTTIGGFTGIGTIGLATVIVDDVLAVSGGKFLGPWYSAHMPFQTIAVGLQTHKDKCGGNCPGILTTYAEVDVSLSACLSLCFSLCFGLSFLISTL